MSSLKEISNKLSYKDFEILESIRGLASLYVVISHCRGILWIGGRMFLDETPVSDWSILDYTIFSISISTRLAVEFVIVFFVLSGFSIAHSLHKSKSNYQFYLKRLIRIYPPYLLALLWAGLVFFITYQMLPNFYDGTYSTATFDRYNQMLLFTEPVQIVKNLFYLPMNGFIVQFWSLSHEVIFYILAPFLVLNQRWYRWTSITLFILYLVSYEITGYLSDPNLIIKFLGVFNFFFFLGFVLYKNFNQIQYKLKILTKSQFKLLIIFFLLATYALNFLLRSETVWSYLTAAGFGILLILYFLKYEVRIHFLIKVGRHSYTLYITHVASIFLYHSLLHYFFEGIEPPYIRNFLVFIPAIFFCILISFIQFNLVEGQTKKILDKIRQNS